ncbi:helix-turn-helix domain-containing protein [Amycolatopsis alba]|uniref:XRE family transcriptional regulator n=1 Tax=Amycolatopsis alba DSM 44262 TaxID=1125972 RepID=A0A229RFK1_AMYAL|nr:helix-turn-helix transcriptional regulator [Amycolatopsis alba]OXM45452.1 XRE family transcriptional regulator [Amycolatopsis alba DSM 44262]
MANASIDVIALHGALDAAREARELSWRQLAKLLDVSPSTMSRLANGKNPDVEAFATMVRWLDVPAEKFMIDDEELQRRAAEPPDLVAELAPLLRARPDLEPEDVEHLEELIGSAVRRFGADRARRVN